MAFERYLRSLDGQVLNPDNPVHQALLNNEDIQRVIQSTGNGTFDLNLYHALRGLRFQEAQNAVGNAAANAGQAALQGIQHMFDIPMWKIVGAFSIPSVINGVVQPIVSQVVGPWFKARGKIQSILAQQAAEAARFKNIGILAGKGGLIATGTLAAGFAAWSAGRSITKLIEGQVEKDVARVKADVDVWADVEKRERRLDGIITEVDSQDLANDHISDVIGHPEITQKLEAIKKRYEHPELYNQFLGKGEHAQTNFIMRGTPGTGKTLAARALANETNSQFISINLAEAISKEIVPEVFSRLEKILSDPETLYKPAIIFFDEIDVLKARKEGMSESQLLANNAFLSLTDGLGGKIPPEKAIRVIGTTNRHETLDPAVKSRFPLVINFPLPGAAERKAMLQHNIVRFNVTPPENLDLDFIAHITEGFSGRDLKSVITLLKEELLDNVQRGQRQLTFTQDQLVSAVNKIALKNSSFEAPPAYGDIHKNIVVSEDTPPPAYSPSIASAPVGGKQVLSPTVEAMPGPKAEKSEKPHNLNIVLKAPEQEQAPQPVKKKPSSLSSLFPVPSLSHALPLPTMVSVGG